MEGTKVPGSGDICDDWPVRFPCDISTASPDVTGSAVEVATEVVWALSGRQFGTCQVTWRPCKKTCSGFLWDNGGFVRPALIQGEWFNLTCGTCLDNCSCSIVSEVVLPSPVAEIVEVKIDGVALPTGSYRLDNSRFLVRTDGDIWPPCNNLDDNDDEVGTWSITAKVGKAVPEGGAWAVGELACELIKGFEGGDCRLPRNVTQLVRQGVTIEYPDITSLFGARLTGLYLVDLFIQTWNPTKLSNRSRTYNVDRPVVRRPNL